MATVTRSTLKGYVYQNYIFTFFLAKMDTDEEVSLLISFEFGSVNAFGFEG